MSTWDLVFAAGIALGTVLFLRRLSDAITHWWRDRAVRRELALVARISIRRGGLAATATSRLGQPRSAAPAPNLREAGRPVSAIDWVRDERRQRLRELQARSQRIKPFLIVDAEPETRADLSDLDIFELQEGA